MSPRLICIRKWWLVFLLVVLAASTMIVLAQNPITVVEQKMSDDISETKRRLDAFDALHVEARLAVIDILNERSWRIELLIIGLVLTTGGHLAFQLWSNHGSQHRHNRRVDDPQDE